MARGIAMKTAKLKMVILTSVLRCIYVTEHISKLKGGLNNVYNRRTYRRYTYRYT